MSEICIQAHNLSKRFSVLKQERSAFRVVKSMLRGEKLAREHWVLRDVSCRIPRGEKLAVIGKNGAGKTTLLRILAGIYRQDAGHFSINGTLRVLLGCWIGLHGELSAEDNVYLFGAVHGIPRDTLKKNMEVILAMAELDDLRFMALKNLSKGQQQRLALSVLFQARGDVFFFDETLGFIDQSFYQKCESYFHELFLGDQKTVILTSHDMAFLKRYARSALWLEDGLIRKFGEVNEVIEEYEGLVSV